MSALRRAAGALARHGAAVMPRAHADWGRAMAAEIDHIAGDAAALHWALGCVWAGYRVRSMSMSGPILIAMRLGLSALVALYAMIQLPVALMVLGYKAGNPDLAGAMDGATAGDDYSRFVPLMEQMSGVQLGAAFLHIAVLLAAAAALALGWRRAPLILAGALVLQIANTLAMSALPAWRATWTAGERMQDVLIIAVIAAMAAAAFWLTAQTPARKA